jgi:hypothetical protein
MFVTCGLSIFWISNGCALGTSLCPSLRQASAVPKAFPRYNLNCSTATADDTIECMTKTTIILGHFLRSIIQ